MVLALRAPGWWRALTYTVAGIAFSYGLSIGARALFGLDPLLDGESVLTIALVAVPFFFLVGLGCFDYWFYWAAGRPTRPVLLVPVAHACRRLVLRRVPQLDRLPHPRGRSVRRHPAEPPHHPRTAPSTCGSRATGTRSTKISS